MNPYKYNINFRLDKRPDAAGDMPINADITFSGKRIFYFTGCKIAESQWNTASQQVRRNNFNSAGVSANDINARLGKIRTAVDEVFSALAHQDIVPTPKSIREALRARLDEEKATRYTVAEYYQMLIDEREEERKSSPSTAKWSKPTVTKHKTLLRHLNDFKRKVYFEDITVEFLEKFEEFLISKGLTNGYVRQAMKSMKGFFNWATKKGYNPNKAYQGFSAQFRDETKTESGVNTFALTEEELEAIKSFQTTSPAIDRTRDLFLFTCYTGMRYCDASNLRWSNIVDGMIDFVAQKTHQHITIPINRFIQSLFDKYASDNPEDYVFPHISNQKYNEQLKVVGQLAGMTGDWKHVRQVGNKVIEEVVPKYTMLSSHAGRRTFTTRALDLGMDSSMIRAVTGHTTSKMMENYVKFDKGAKKRFMDDIDDAAAADSTTKKEPSNVYDLAQSKKDKQLIQRMLSIPDEDKYYALLEKDSVLAVVHLAVVLWNLDSAASAAKFIDRLPKDRYKEFLNLLCSTEAWKK